MNELLSRLPHKPPALLLTHVYEVSEESAVCGYTVSENALTVLQGLSSAYALEMLAQAVALVLTHSGDQPLSGMLAQCRSLVCPQPFFSFGMELIIYAKLEGLSAGVLALCSGRVEESGSGLLLAEATFSIYLNNQ